MERKLTIIYCVFTKIEHRIYQLLELCSYHDVLLLSIFKISWISPETVTVLILQNTLFLQLRNLLHQQHSINVCLALVSCSDMFIYICFLSTQGADFSLPCAQCDVFQIIRLPSCIRVFVMFKWNIARPFPSSWKKCRM